MEEVSLDTSGLRCPLPILEAAKALRALPAEAILRVLATDPAFERDLPAFCEAAGHALLGLERLGSGAWVGRLKKRGE